MKIIQIYEKTKQNKIIFESNHSISNSTDLISKIKKKSIRQNHTLVSFGIINLYRNIPITEIIDILKK